MEHHSHSSQTCNGCIVLCDGASSLSTVAGKVQRDTQKKHKTCAANFEEASVGFFCERRNTSYECGSYYSIHSSYRAYAMPSILLHFLTIFSRFFVCLFVLLLLFDSFWMGAFYRALWVALECNFAWNLKCFVCNCRPHFSRSPVIVLFASSSLSVSLSPVDIGACVAIVGTMVCEERSLATSAVYLFSSSCYSNIHLGKAERNCELLMRRIHLRSLLDELWTTMNHNGTFYLTLCNYEFGAKGGPAPPAVASIFARPTNVLVGNKKNALIHISCSFSTSARRNLSSSSR